MNWNLGQWTRKTMTEDEYAKSDGWNELEGFYMTLIQVV